MAPNRVGRALATLVVAILAITVAAIPVSAVPFNEADFSGYATGQVLHVDTLAASGVELAQASEAWTGSVVDSKGITQIVNEVDNIVFPAAANKRTAARGSGLELGLGVDQATENQLQLQIAKAAAPPNTSVVEEIPPGGLSIPPLAYASLLRGQADANWSDSSTCVLGKDLASGIGYAADVQLVDTGAGNEDGTLDAPLLAVDAEPTDPDRSVAFSQSHNFLAVQQNAAGAPLGLKFGLASEVRMTIAPVTIADGVTLELLGEWVLRAMAGGVPGSAHVHFGPGEVSPQTPILNIIQDGVDNIIVSLQDILGDEGIVIPIPEVAEIRIGQPPHAIGDQDAPPSIAANGTSASAAIDIVSVELLNGDLADLRFGHMEVSAQVPVGGIDCGVPVSKTASPKGVTVGQAFTVSIKVDNPFGCDMTAVKVVDNITTEGSAKFQVLSTNPPANQVPAGSNLDEGTIVWDNIGPIPKGGSKTVTVSIRAQGGGGIIKDIATASALLGNCEGEGDGSTLVGNSLPLEVPVVLTVKDLPETGLGTSGALYLSAIAMLGLAAVGIRSLRRNKA
ncbi:MAG: hypothetical protein ACRDKG_00410 [Actinomycetota bacterium]